MQSGRVCLVVFHLMDAVDDRELRESYRLTARSAGADRFEQTAVRAGARRPVDTGTAPRAGGGCAIRSACARRDITATSPVPVFDSRPPHAKNSSKQPKVKCRWVIERLVLVNAWACQATKATA